MMREISMMTMMMVLTSLHVSVHWYNFVKDVWSKPMMTSQTRTSAADGVVAPSFFDFEAVCPLSLVLVAHPLSKS